MKHIDWTDALIVAGVVVVIVGFWLLSLPLALIIGGVLLFVGGVGIGTARHR